ncbi:type II toxin-antitoxin system RelE/ParE family toxin [Bosea sp. (in: a-proteobacteria)]|uniref:type II toxin-antitoxin system RelE/ParE family toxin n=1 Tax=Bosea sp. (in: a-proteobacteria) TaxID=1871050 RepID=UPI003B3A4E37
MTLSAFAVELTQGAVDDLEAIHRYISAHRSPAAGDALLDQMLATVTTLERFPDRGSCPAELERLGIREFRQLLCEPYRLIYRTVGQTVFVLLIADGRRDLQSLLERRLLGR